MTFGEIFIIGIVVIVLCVMAEEFLEAYDEWRKDIDDELQYGILSISCKMVGNIPNVTNLKLRKYK